MAKKNKTPVYYQTLCPIDSSVASRRHYNIGDVFENKAKCKLCGDIIISQNRHHNCTCSCGNLSVDGGSWYCKRSFYAEDSYIEMSVYYGNLQK